MTIMRFCQWRVPGSELYKYYVKYFSKLQLIIFFSSVLAFNTIFSDIILQAGASERGLIL